MKRLKAGSVGLTDRGRQVYEALLADPLIELVAVADRDRATAKELAEAAGAAAYDDHRLAVVESAARGLEALFVALPPLETEECLRVAAGARVAAFTLPPVARSFETARTLADLFADAECPLVVARNWQFEPAYMRLHDPAALAGHVFAVNADLTAAARGPHGWWGDSRRAGGGVLLQGGYEMMDAIVGLLGVPSEVYAALGFAVPPGRARPYDTEDTASVICRYADDRTGIVTCRRGGPCEDWRITLCGSKATVVVTPRSLSVSGEEDAEPKETAVRTANRYGPAVSVFAASLSSGVSRMPSEVGDHLGTMAAIAAAYLSARTGQGESPGRFLERPGLGER